MIVPVRQWTLVRPLRLALRARRVQKIRPIEERAERNETSVMDQFAKLMEHQANLMFRDYTKE